MPPTLPAAHAEGAARRGVSSAWARLGATPVYSGATRLGSSASSAATAAATMSTVSHLAANIPALRSSAPSSSLVLQPRRVKSVTFEAAAGIAAERRIALQAHVGPHVGPGSGAPLNYMISRMKSRLEGLEDAYGDKPDTDDEDSMDFVGTRYGRM